MIYFIQAEAGGPIKVGMTRQLSVRLSALRSDPNAGDGSLRVLGVMDGERDVEAAVHRQFAHCRIQGGEWFHPGPELMEFIATMGRPWDGEDEVPAPACAKIDADVLKMVRLVAEYCGISAAEYLTEVVRPIVERDLKHEIENFRLPEPKKGPKGKGGAK